jgi:hypothetical protein
MPVIQGSVSVAGLGVNDNVLQGSQFEYLPYNAALAFGLNGDANGADLRVDVFSGQDVLMEAAPMSAQNRIPVWPDDYQLTDVAGGGERLKIRVRNTNAAARTIFWAIRIQPLPTRRR